MDFENSQTKKNLEAAFAGESQAHTKYRYYASRAQEGRLRSDLQHLHGDRSE